MGTGYTRNDTPNNIADGNVINASDLDGEFDAIQSAFNGSTGHSHDGTTGEGPQIATAGLADNAVTTAKITDANVTTAKIADSNVTTAKINNGAVTSAKLDTNIQIAGTLGVTGETTLTTHLNMGDNDIIKLGAGSDLEIFSDGGTFSYINNTQGVLRIRNTSDDQDVVIQSDNGSGGVTDYFMADGSSGEAKLFHYGAEKLKTTSTGIDVTGTATMDGLTVDGDVTINTGAGALTVDAFGGGSVQVSSNGAYKHISTLASGYHLFEVNSKSVAKFDNSGDISFYEDTGSTVKLFWDASAERLGIGTDNPSTPLNIVNTANTLLRLVCNSSTSSDASRITLTHDKTASNFDNVGYIDFNAFNSSAVEHLYGRIQVEATDVTDGSEDGRFRIYTLADGSVHEAIRITSTNLVINENGSDADFRVESDGNANMLFVDGGNNTVNIGTSTNLGGALNIDGQIVQESSSSIALKLQSTQDDNNTGPYIYLYGNSSSPAANDITGGIVWRYNDDGGSEQSGMQINHILYDVSAASDDTGFAWYNKVAGTDRQIFTKTNSEIIVNQDSVDLDFRVESDSNSNMLFVDAGNDKVGIGNGTPEHPLSVTGTTQILAGDNIAGSLANGATADVITSVPRGFSYVNISRSDTSSGGLLLLLYTTTSTTTIVSTVSDQTGSAYSASTSGRALRVTNSTGGTISFYASCMNLAWVSGG